MDALLHSLLIYSGNDAGIAIADHVAGSEEAFAKMMNEEAKKIGAIHSHFVNPHGLHDDNHYTTAYYLYLIFHELLKNDTFRSIISMDSYEAVYKDRDGNDKTKTFKTTNKYLNGSVEAVDNIKIIGGKTGTTDKAGNCLILLSEDNKNNDYISLILKADSSESLYSEMSDLLSMAAGD
jgi:D-alanyl-D-alanine carboxypeptidase